MKNYNSLYLLVFLTSFTACQSDTPVNIPDKIKAPIEATSVAVQEIVDKSTPDDKELGKVKGEEEKMEEEAPEKTKEEIASEKRRAERRAKRREKRKREAKEAEERAKAALIAEQQEAIRSQSSTRNSTELNTTENSSNIDVSATEIEYEEEPLVPQGPVGILSFPVRSYDFGRIEEGDRFEHEFKFFNSGDAPIVISDIKASCGCTKTTYPKEPIMPGEQGLIGVTFESKGKLGRQKPFMSVVTNGFPQIYSLYMEGIVETEKKQ